MGADPFPPVSQASGIPPHFPFLPAVSLTSATDYAINTHSRPSCHSVAFDFHTFSQVAPGTYDLPSTPFSHGYYHIRFHRCRQKHISFRFPRNISSATPVFNQCLSRISATRIQDSLSHVVATIYNFSFPLSTASPPLSYQKSKHPLTHTE